jgi:hypothetical protein
MWDAITKHAATAFGATAATLAAGHAVKIGRRARANRDVNYELRLAAEQMRDDADAILSHMPQGQRVTPAVASQVVTANESLHSAAQTLRLNRGRGAFIQAPPGPGGHRNAPTTKQRREMGSSRMALPWDQASATYKRKHSAYTGVGGYPMDTRKRASAARGYAIAELNAGNLTQSDVRVIYARTARRWGFNPLEKLACTKRGKKRRCRSVT